MEWYWLYRGRLSVYIYQGMDQWFTGTCVRHIPHTKDHIHSKLVRCKYFKEYWYLWTLFVFCLQSYDRWTEKTWKSHKKALLWAFYRSQNPSKHPFLSFFYTTCKIVFLFGLLQARQGPNLHAKLESWIIKTEICKMFGKKWKVTLILFFLSIL